MKSWNMSIIQDITANIVNLFPIYYFLIWVYNSILGFHTAVILCKDKIIKS